MATVADRAKAAAPAAEGARLRRDMGRTALLFTSVGSVIGSGWLLGAMNATQIGGPAAIISWVVGAVAIMLLALIHAELGGMHHVNGGMARFPHYAFGSLVGYGMGGSTTWARGRSLPSKSKRRSSTQTNGSTRPSASTSCTWWARA